jgi:hypothetical protein
MGRGDSVATKDVGMRIGGLVGGVILTVLGALMLAEGIITLLGNPSFIFIESMNRGFELTMGFVTIVVAGTAMNLSRA